jgi:hypothetical protein
MTGLWGRSPRGERLVCHAPHGHWETTTMISSARVDGISACMTVEGATNTESLLHQCVILEGFERQCVLEKLPAQVLQ